MPYDLLTDRDDLRSARWSAAPLEEIPEGGLRVEPLRLALSANNFSYAKLGDSLGFWGYFPAPSGFGRIPAWGIARVSEARAKGFAEGETIYGFLPVSTHLTLTPQARGAGAFIDAAPHRAALPPTYNEYRRVAEGAIDDAYLVLRPLFSLGFFLSAYLREQHFFGAERALITSASSKTAASVAFGIGDEIEVLGLTSGRHVAGVKQTGFFPRVLAYGEIDDALDGRKTLLIDIAGDDEFRARLRDRLGASLVRTVAVGATRAASALAWPSHDAGSNLEGFFAPAHILRLRALWGAEVLREKLSSGLAAFTERIRPALSFQIFAGRSEIERAYLAVADGALPGGAAAILVDPKRP